MVDKSFITLCILSGILQYLVSNVIINLGLFRKMTLETTFRENNNFYADLNIYHSLSDRIPNWPQHLLLYVRVDDRRPFLFISEVGDCLDDIPSDSNN